MRNSQMLEKNDDNLFISRLAEHSLKPYLLIDISVSQLPEISTTQTGKQNNPELRINL